MAFFTFTFTFTFYPDRDMAALYGEAMGAEFKAKGTNVMLGPGLNLLRVPMNGRTFEYISGEDPVLGAELVKAFLAAAKKTNVTTCIKHYVNNNNEHDRLTTSAIAHFHSV